MSTAKNAAEVIAALLAHAGLDLPVRLRAWDGSEAGSLEPLDGPVLVARSPRALQRILWRPGELGLARAYLSGDLDVEGDLTDGLRRVHALGPRPGLRPFGLAGTGLAAVRAAARLGLLAPPPEPPRCELRVRGRRHSRARARVRVTGVTLSREQGGYVRRRARGLGLTEDRVQVRIQDYRDPLDGPYDAIASVEMGEHVGAGRYPAFCAALYGRLRPGGRLLIQQMSRTTRRGGGPFIESYIAPDMDMRPVGDTVRRIQDAGFEVIGVEAMREHYARTIRAWLENFERNLPAISTILTAEQVRVWRLYLAGGALAFEQGRMGVDQILAQRPSR